MKKLLKLIGKYKIFLVFSVIFAAISVVLQLYVPVLFGDAIDEVVSAHQVNFDMMWYYLKQIRDISICYVVHESVEQPDDLPDRAGYPFTGNPSYPGTAVVLSGSAQHRRYCKPCHCRYRYLIRWSVVGIYTVIFRNRDDRCDTDFHVL